MPGLHSSGIVVHYSTSKTRLFPICASLTSDTFDQGFRRLLVADPDISSQLLSLPPLSLIDVQAQGLLICNTPARTTDLVPRELEQGVQFLELSALCVGQEDPDKDDGEDALRCKEEERPRAVQVSLPRKKIIALWILAL